MKINFLDGPYAGQEFEFNSPNVTIGRDGGNQLILDTDGVSRCHAELKQQGDGSWRIFDLNSTNGVKVNGVRINSSAAVCDGDKLVIGENSMEIFRLSQEPSRVIFNPIISVPPEIPDFKGQDKEPAKSAESLQGNRGAEPEAFSQKSPVLSASASDTRKESETHSALDLKSLSGSLFSRKDGANKSGKREESDGDGGNSAGKKRSNRIFYTVLVCVVIMILSTVFSAMNPSKKQSGNSKVPPVVIRYEKEVITKNNVFRFEFDLNSSFVKVEPKEDQEKKEPSYRREYSVVFTIDDIASKRHYSRKVALSDESVNELREVIRNSGIFTAEQEKKSGESNIRRRLTIVNGNRILNMEIAGEFASAEFNAVEDELIRITEAFGIKTIAMTPEELVQLAERAFGQAEDLYANRRAGGANLRDAIRNYQVTVESLEQFSPKPPRWEEARIKLAQAVKERDDLLAALETEYKKLSQQRAFEEMKPVFRQMMELTDPESRQHGSARRRLIYIEQRLRKKK